jgi:2-polyprenyl-3-methyl-5-hydroxy-6-metoxy-1,4-benzoquinol methylase
VPEVRRVSRASVRKVGKPIVGWFTHALGRRGRRHYFEDFVRVYPGEVAYNRLGRRRKPTPNDLKNFKNHAKFYEFAAQFAQGKVVVDAGCGSGYGCKILDEAGAETVLAFDASGPALQFAREEFGTHASFSLQTITDLSYGSSTADLVVCSEVLEHLREYGVEDRALAELERILRPGGLLVVGTPNSELLGKHGFGFAELSALVARHFADYVVFENALVPFDADALSNWEQRHADGLVGVIAGAEIDLSETIIPEGARPELKQAAQAGQVHPLKVGAHEVDTTRLHNTHSFVVLAVAG